MYILKRDLMNEEEKDFVKKMRYKLESLYDLGMKRDKHEFTDDKDEKINCVQK